MRHHLCETPASLCDPPKDPAVQHVMQNWGGMRKIKSIFMAKVFIFAEAIPYLKMLIYEKMQKIFASKF